MQRKSTKKRQLLYRKLREGPVIVLQDYRICHVRLKRSGAWWYEANSNHMWLLLDSRVVDVSRSSNLIVVTLSSWNPFFFNGFIKPTVSLGVTSAVACTY